MRKCVLGITVMDICHNCNIYVLEVTVWYLWFCTGAMFKGQVLINDSWCFLAGMINHGLREFAYCCIAQYGDHYKVFCVCVCVCVVFCVCVCVVCVSCVVCVLWCVLCVCVGVVCVVVCVFLCCVCVVCV
jgi:hypothetical protein